MIEFSATDQGTTKLWATFARKAVVLLLLFTVAGLATFAKNGQYYPKSNPAQHISVSIKLNVAHSPAHAAEKPLQPVARFLIPQPPLHPPRMQVEEIPTALPIGVTVSMQHRSPPLASSCTLPFSSVDDSTI